MLAFKPCFSTQYSYVTRLIFIVESIPHKKEQNQAQKYDLFFLHQCTIVLRCNYIVLRFFQNQQSKKLQCHRTTMGQILNLNFESLSTKKDIIYEEDDSFAWFPCIV